MREEKKFEFEGKDYFIKPMGAKQLAEGRKVYTKTFKRAIENGAILKKSLDDHMRKQGLWDDEKQEEYTDLIKKSADLEYQIKSGKFKKASELKEKALELRKLRDETSFLMSARNSMDSVTAEGQADNQQFNYFVAACVYDYLTQKPVFSSLEDYEDQIDSKIALECASQFASYFYDLDDDFESTLLENKVLKKLNLLDKEGFLVNRDGHRVDAEGNLVDEEGARIDSAGNRIDINNNPIIDDDVINSLEFEDDLPQKTKPTKDAAKETEVKKTSGSRRKKSKEPVA
tara:strand:+ start:331 stop:1191 length:861 start_codon:yes stop_codon:yes gene_type:complete